MTTQFTPSAADASPGRNAQAGGAADQELVAAARMLLQRMKVDPADLMTDPADRPPVPAFDEYVPQVEDAVSPGTAKTYSSYWNRIRAKWGSRTLLEPTPTEIKQFAEEVKANAIQRRNSRGGRGTAENFIAALRCIYRHAEDDELIKPDENPARRTAKPRRQGSVRHALSANQMSEINFYAGTTGDDPELDTLLLRLHTESACRTGGALALRPRDLNEDQCLIYLREKDGTARWQPVSRSLTTALLDHAQERGSADDPGGQLLRYRNGNPITHRRYDHLWVRLGRYQDLQLAVNLRAPVLLTRQCLPLLRKAARGAPERGARIVALASITGVAAEAGIAMYSATKAALISLCESVTLEESAAGVSATAISPGYVDTEMTAWLHDELPPEEMIPVSDVVELVRAVTRLSANTVVPNIVLSRRGHRLWRA